MKSILVLLALVLTQSAFAFDHLEDTNLMCRTFPQNGSISGTTMTFYFADKVMDENRNADLETTFFGIDSASIDGNSLAISTHASGGYEFDYNTTSFTLDLSADSVSLKSSDEFKVQMHTVRTEIRGGFEYNEDSEGYCHFVSK